MLVLTVISFDCRLLRSRLQLDHELQSTPHQLAQAPYKQILRSARPDALGMADF